MDKTLLIIVICIVIFLISLSLVIWYFFRDHPKDKRKRKDIDFNDTQKSQTHIEKVNIFINEKREQKGRDDALAGAITMEEGMDAIRGEGVQICDNEIDKIKTEVIKFDVQIATFKSKKHDLDAANIEISKKQKEEEISQIENKKKSLKDDKDLPVLTSYEKGFKEGERAKIKAMFN